MRRTGRTLVALLAGLILLLALAQQWNPTHAQVEVDGVMFIVNSTADEGDDDTDDEAGACDTGREIAPGVAECTLRAAIEQANQSEEKDLILFNIPPGDPGYDAGEGVFSIRPVTPLPTITQPVVIDGYSQPSAVPNSSPDGIDATLAIQLLGDDIEGASAQQHTSGLILVAGDSEIRGLVIGGFTRAGILVLQSDNNVIQGNFLGTNAAGNAEHGNWMYGVELWGASSNNLIGGTTPPDRNLISGNGHNGVVIANGPTSHNRVQGNYIGTDRTGAAALPNGLDGVLISAQWGLFNFPTENVVGGTEAGAGNLISGNGNRGIEIYGGVRNEIKGNYIGTDLTGTQALPNEGGGVQVWNGFSKDNVIGGAEAGAGNLISGNLKHGILLERRASGTTISGNLIGTTLSGDEALPNEQSGIWMTEVEGSRIGGQSASERNLISGNGEDGITLSASTTTNNIIASNYIGTDLTGSSELGNGRHGVYLFGAVNTSIGQADAEPLVISGNGEHGVVLADSATGNALVNSYIGVSADGMSALPNDHGVVILGGAHDNRIGGESAAERNVISGNDLGGIFLYGAGTRENKVYGNYIGTNREGTAPTSRPDSPEVDYSNKIGVILGEKAKANAIGGPLPGQGNLISANLQHGILLQDIGTTANLILGNHIGGDEQGACVLDANGACPLGNGYHGVVVIDDASGNIIGKPDPGAGNVIAYNGRLRGLGGHGINVVSGTGISIRGNSIYENAGRAIDLGSDVQYAFGVNDAMDLDSGPNNLQNYPVVTKLDFTWTGSVDVTWTLYSLPNQSYTLDFYSNPKPDLSGFGEGHTYLGSEVISTNADGVGSVTRRFGLLDTFISATATDQFGSTSEFSMVDTDGDALADAWESSFGPEHLPGLDVNEDGVRDLALPGADYRHKDIFVEIDAMVGRVPSQAALDMVVNGRPGRTDEGFANAPNALVQNPDANDGINLHLELDEINIPLAPWVNLQKGWALGFDQLKQTHFGTVNERQHPNAQAMLAARRLAYRYAIFGDRFGNTATSGMAERPGNDFYVTLGAWATPGGTDEQQAGTLMHELGHTLNLLHGGDDRILCKPNYHSVMNYTWQTPGTYDNSYRGSWVLDYSRETFHEIDESQVVRLDGLGGDPNHQVPVGPSLDANGNQLPIILADEGGPFPPSFLKTSQGTYVEVGPRDLNLVAAECERDDNNDGVIDAADRFVVLKPHEDWSNLQYYVVATLAFDDGVHPDVTHHEVTLEMVEAFSSAGDTNGILQFSHPVYEVFESDGEAVLRVTRGNGTWGQVTVEYSVTAGTATDGADYTSVSGTLTFEEGEYHQFITVPVMPDHLEESPYETVQLTLSAPSGGATLGDAAVAELRIRDDESAGVLQFESEVIGVHEEDGTAEVRISRTGGTAGAVTVRVRTEDGTAVAGEDYIATDETVTFDAYESLATVLVPLVNDTVAEGTETIRLVLEAPGGGAQLGEKSNAQVNIIASDNASDAIVVATTNDSGPGSLRQAILDANQAPGHDRITFNIPGEGVRTIRPLIPLPPITDPLTIDGYSQPGASPNTLAEGNDARLLIELDGTQTAPYLPSPDGTGSTRYIDDGLTIETSNSTIRGLVINRFQGSGIVVNRHDDTSGAIAGNVIEGNFIGSDASGTEDRGNGSHGIEIAYGAARTRIGGLSPDTRNIISGNEGDGVHTHWGGQKAMEGTLIQGNYIGVQRDGATPLGNGGDGIELRSNEGALVGGTVPGSRNVIAHNGGAGVLLHNQIHGSSEWYERLGLRDRNKVLANSIFANGEPGIVRWGAMSVNDPGDLDSRQNYPIIESVTQSGPTTLEVRGRLESEAEESYRIEIYLNEMAHPAGYGDGQELLGGLTVDTDANGVARFAVSFEREVPAGAVRAATATHEVKGTSEFSPRFGVGETPRGLFIVNSADDHDDGLCNATHCSLREAILSANNHRALIPSRSVSRVACRPSPPLPCFRLSRTRSRSMAPPSLASAVARLSN